MTDPLVAEKQNTIEYSEIVKEIDPFGAKIENLPFRIPIYFYDEDPNLSDISKEELTSLSEAFPNVEISNAEEDTYVTCTISGKYFALTFQTKGYCFYTTFPFLGYIMEPFYEEYRGEISQGRRFLKNGTTEEVLKKIKCLRDIMNNKIDVRFAKLEEKAIG